MTNETSQEPAQTIQYTGDTDRRDTLWAQAVRLLVLINGGSAVALIALLPAIWDKAPALVIWIAKGLFVFAVGVALAVWIPMMREATARAWTFNPPPLKAKVLYYLYRSVAYCSLGSFLLGVALIALGIFFNLPVPHSIAI